MTNEGRAHPINERICVHELIAPNSQFTVQQSSVAVTSSPRQQISHDQPVHFRIQEAAHRLLRRADDRFMHVKRRIEQDRHAGVAREGFEQKAIARIRIGIDGLDPRRTVHMHHRGNRALGGDSDGSRKQHEG